MKTHRMAALAAGLLFTWLAGAAAQAPQRLAVTSSVPLAEARVIIEGAEAFARTQKIGAAAVVVDQAGNLVSADLMDDTAFHDLHFATGKATAAVLLGQPTSRLAELAKTRPDRYFGILNMYPGQVYLVGGGVPLAVDGKLIGAVGVAGLPEGVDEKAALAGIAAWTQYRAAKGK